jgi:Putative transmembrane protein (PGPGW)
MSRLADWFADALDWIATHVALTTVTLVVSGVVLVGSLWICHYVLVTIPPEYCNHEHKPFAQWRTARPALWWTLMITKNVLGALLVVTGLIMFFTPGQGILTLILGLSLVDFPGKHKLLRKIVKRPSVLKVINGMRGRADQPPLEIS